MDTQVIYTTPRSKLQLNTSEFEPSIYCNMKSSYIVNTSGEYDKNKYEIRSKLYSLTVTVPRYHGIYYNDLITSVSYDRLNLGEIQFLNQTDDNIIYGQEGMSTNISCTTVTGYDAGELSIQQNNRILAISNSNIVTFSLIPKRQDSFTKFRCVGNDSTLADVYVMFVIKYAPDVNVVVRENRIDCLRNGFPTTYTFKKWEHQSPQENTSDF
ncbi:unnamed protein product [Mytilus edulis]|uniref:Uncharacterized protein n=1 Tax=Mytilus edulis TaxID=6550 RepID=A0A8S3SMW8_MYTED|nr:unnamed protein product [Mytilus edulis]